MDVGLSVSVRLGEVETIEYQRDRGMAVTVYFGTRKGSASTADLGAARCARRWPRPAASPASRRGSLRGLADPDTLATEFPTSTSRIRGT
jgi:PmbA protein